MLFLLIFITLSLIKNAKRVVLKRVLLLFNHVSAIDALPTFKLDEVVKKGLHHH
jgi:hypothetical protein